jgi:arginase
MEYLFVTADLDAQVLPGPDGLSVGEVEALLADLAPRAAGARVTIFDPDLDPDGTYARLLSTLLTAGFARLGSEGQRDA